MKASTRDRIIFLIGLTLVAVSIVSAQVIGPDGITGFTWINGTSANIANMYLSGDDVTDILDYPYEATTYIIFSSGGTFYAKNGETGNIDYSGANPATVIQNAINASTNGGRILFKEAAFPGYTLSSKIIIPYSILIEGEGEGTYIRNNIADDYIFDVRTDHVTIRNICFNGNTKNGHAILLRDPRQITIEGCIFYNFKTVIDIVNDLQNANKGWIRDNYISTCDYGIRFRTPSGGWANEFLVEGNYLYTIANTGIELGAGNGTNSDTKILYNTINDADIGINLMSNLTYYTKIHFNHLETFTTVAINFSTLVKNVHITHNRISDPWPRIAGDYDTGCVIEMNDGVLDYPRNMYADILSANYIMAGGINATGYEEPDQTFFSVNTSFPTDPAEGNLFYHLTNNLLYFYNGTDWVSVIDQASGGTGPTPPASNATVLWYTKCQNGTEEWEAGGGWYGDSFYTSPYSTVTDKPNVNLTGVVKDYIKVKHDDPTVASDPWSNDRCRAELKRRGYQNQNGSWCEGFNEETDLWYSVKFYLPANFTLTEGTGSWGQGVSFVQLHEGPSIGWGGGLRSWINENPETDWQICSHHYENGSWIYEVLDSNIPIITGELVTFTMHRKYASRANGGIFECWINSTKFVSDKGDYGVGPDAQALGYVSAYLQVGLYSGYNQPVKEMWIERAIVATSEAAIENFMNVTL